MHIITINKVCILVLTFCFPIMLIYIRLLALLLQLLLKSEYVSGCVSLLH